MKHIGLEGIDGGGKSTQFKIQTERLIREYGPERVAFCRHDLYNNFFGKIVKKVYIEQPDNPLFYPMRNRVVRETLHTLYARSNIRQTEGLDRDIVLSDRGVMTSFAYHTGKIPEWYLTALWPEFYPDTVIYIDISPELAIERIKKRGGVVKPGETLEKLQEFREGYELTINEKRPRVLRHTKIVRIDGAQSLDKVTEDVHEAIVRGLN